MEIESHRAPPSAFNNAYMTAPAPAAPFADPTLCRRAVLSARDGPMPIFQWTFVFGDLAAMEVDQGGRDRIVSGPELGSE